MRKPKQRKMRLMAQLVRSGRRFVRVSEYGRMHGFSASGGIGTVESFRFLVPA